jgi:hypothetical protein
VVPWNAILCMASDVATLRPGLGLFSMPRAQRAIDKWHAPSGPSSHAHAFAWPRHCPFTNPRSVFLQCIQGLGYLLLHLVWCTTICMQTKTWRFLSTLTNWIYLSLSLSLSSGRVLNGYFSQLSSVSYVMKHTTINGPVCESIFRS